MAELFVVIGGIASVAQLLGYILRTSRAVNRFCDEVQDAPFKLRRIEEKLCLLQKAVEEIREYLRGFGDDVILPPDLRYVLAESIRRINKDMKDAATVSRGHSLPLSGSLRKRFNWALMERRNTEKLMSRLDESEGTLDRVIQLVNLRSSLLSCLHIRQSANLMEQLYATLTNRGRTADSREHSSPILRQIANSENRSAAIKVHQRLAFISVDSWLRSLGFYGSIRLISRNEGVDRVRVVFGFKFPPWMSNTSIDLEIEFARLSAQEFGVRIMPGQIKVQNRVSRESPFMMACLKGDVRLIQQHLEEKSGSIRDRTICTGKTPLMLAIEGQHLNAMKYLLDHGSDPNIGDDDQVLPVFAALGMYPRRNRYFAQLPPNWSSWLAAFRMLVDHGASVHEVNYGRSLATLNILHGGPAPNSSCSFNFEEPNAVEFFQILHDQYYIDFNVASEGGWCAMLTAIRRRTKSVEALQFLSSMKVDFTRISETGQSSLHWAAEMGYDVRCLEYLCTTAAIENIDRQDQWGWTPLHYAVASERYGYREAALDKIRCLLQNGADPELKGRSHQFFFKGKLSMDEFTPSELCRATDPDLSRQFEEILAQTIKTEPNRHDTEVFFDALEEQL